jgi:hypothetical protein
LVYLISLLKQSLFDLDQVAIIPRQDGDFTIGMRNFSDNAHFLPGFWRKVGKNGFEEKWYRLFRILLVVQLVIDLNQFFLEVLEDRAFVELIAFHLDNEVFKLGSSVFQSFLQGFYFRFHQKSSG